MRNMSQDKKMDQLLKWSLENPNPHQLELCFFMVENDQLVFISQKETSCK